MSEQFDPSILTPVQRLTRDMANAARTMSDAEARFLVDAYYSMQDARIHADGQIRSIVKNPVDTGEVDEDGEAIHAIEPHDVLQWLSTQNATLEGQVKRSLEKYADAQIMGPWMTDIFGIGPVISAGLLAHISMQWMQCSDCGKKENVTKPCKCGAPFVRKTLATAGQLWRFAGLDPSVRWAKKTKRPWNAQLKVVCYKAGDSFIKFHNDPRCFYGHVWKKQKAIYVDRNERGLYAERSATILSERNYRKDTDAYAAYSVGKFPPAHVNAMARRFAVKLFLSHLHGEMHRRILGSEPPLPYPIAILGHGHMIHPPVVK